MKKIRLDQYLSENKMTDSREIAKKLIMAGQITVNERVIDKAAYLVNDEDNIAIRQQMPYVSRGGYKLEKAIKIFDLDVTDLTVLDVGASTGGFTDVLLQNGAEKVYSVDVGYGQLSWKLRNNPQVVVLERTNARYLTPDSLGGICDMAVCDASFISLTKLIPAMDVCTSDTASIVTLIKPQFEAGREQVGKGGVIRKKEIHIETIQKVVDFVSSETSFTPIGLDFSPITGPKGNVEFLLFCKKQENQSNININQVVENAHSQLKEKK